MSSARLAVYAAVLAVVAWIVKGIAIAAAGGLDKSALESPLFVVGMLALIIALGAFGVAVTAGRPVPVRALAAVGAIVVGVMLSILVQNAVKAALPDSTDWVQEEAGLWIGSILVAALIAMVLRSRSTPATPVQHGTSSADASA